MGAGEDAVWPRGNMVWYWGPVLIYCIVIYVQSSYPVQVSLPNFPYEDKVLHLVGYGILGGLSCRALLATFPQWGMGRLLMVALLFTALYGISDEIHQSFVPSRTADIFDAVADFTGGLLGAAFFYWISRKNLRKEMHP